MPRHLLNLGSTLGLQAQNIESSTTAHHTNSAQPFQPLEVSEDAEDRGEQSETHAPASPLIARDPSSPPEHREQILTPEETTIVFTKDHNWNNSFPSYAWWLPTGHIQGETICPTDSQQTSNEESDTNGVIITHEMVRVNIIPEIDA